MAVPNEGAGLTAGVDSSNSNGNFDRLVDVLVGEEKRSLSDGSRGRDLKISRPMRFGSSSHMDKSSKLAVKSAGAYRSSTMTVSAQAHMLRMNP